jgi:hypothetical protein
MIVQKTESKRHLAVSVAKMAGHCSIGDPALDRPKLVTDMCKNIDLTMGAFQINHLVSRFSS